MAAQLSRSLLLMRTSVQNHAGGTDRRIRKMSLGLLLVRAINIGDLYARNDDRRGLCRASFRSLLR
jgi:hypothetical protein